jgi:tRNA threonylcarbamoyladenosine biosynthesis protein TsaE
MDYKFTSKDEQDTLELAENIESEKFPNMVICLNGELGSGKTVFVKGFANAMAIDETITSPTFNIIKEYLSGELPLYHMDVYSLEDDSNNIGIEEYFTKGGVTIIEWADMISNILPEERLDINIVVTSENARVFKFVPHGKIYEDLLTRVL